VVAHNFIFLDEKTHEKILQWRNHPATAQFGFSTTISWESHLSFLSDLRDSVVDAYWLIFYRSQPVAVCSLKEISSGSAVSGNYIVPGKIGFGVLANLVIHEIGFNMLSLRMIRGEIMKENTSALRIAKFFGADLIDEKNVIRVLHDRNSWLENRKKTASMMRVFMGESSE
jgi:hypothetical protein